MNDEDFLARWSRRKRAAEEPSEAAAPPSLPDVQKVKDASAVKAEAEPAEDLDLSTLPSLDSITAATDVTAFLRKGVPLTLTREALRRAWLADPAIRDFVGLAENGWDFNDPGVMPGFGPLDHTPEQVRDLVARIVDDTRPRAEGDVEDIAASPSQQDHVMSAGTRGEPFDREAVTDAVEFDAAGLESRVEKAEAGSNRPQNSPATIRSGQSDGFSVVHRTHGSALPR